MNLVKIVSPEPGSVADFLDRIMGFGSSVSVPQLSGVPDPQIGSTLQDESTLSEDTVYSIRGADGSGGFLVGNEPDCRFQIFRGAEPRIWAMGISADDVEIAHSQCQADGIPCTELATDMTFDGRRRIDYFFALVGGIVFQVLRSVAASDRVTN